MKVLSISKEYSIAVIILVCCFALGWLDHETHSILDLFHPGNLVALFLYFAPTYAISYGLFRLFTRYGSRDSLVWALCLGIPVGFTLVIIALSFWMGRL